MIGRDITGEKFNHLTVIKSTDKRSNEHVLWLCQCECGNEVCVPRYKLVNGNTKSCGCLQKNKSSKFLRDMHLQHGMTDTDEHRIWRGMWERCTNKNNPHYDKYKDRMPPDSWKDFEVFLKDMGKRPSERHSIDRINNDGPYGPTNCRWATQEQQANNMSSNVFIEYRGARLTLAQWARQLGMTATGLRYRLKHWSLERAMEHKT